MNADQPTSDPLASYLSTLTIEYPESPVINIKDKDITFSQITLHGIDIRDVPSRYVPATILGVGVDGLGTRLTFHYSYKVGPKTVGSDVEIIVKNMNVSVDLEIGKENEYPVSAKFFRCDIGLPQVVVDHVSLSKKDVPDIDPAVLVQKLFDVIICQTLGNYLANDVTQFMVETLDPALTKIVESPPTPYPVYNQHYVSWNDSIVSKVHNIVEKMRGISSLPDFLKCMAQPDGSALSSLLSKLPLATDSYTLNLLPCDNIRDSNCKSQVKPFRSEGGFNIYLVSATVSGLDSLCDLEILEPLPESKVTLRTGGKLENLDVVLGLHIEVNYMQQGTAMTYNEDLNFKLSLKNPSIVLDTVVAVDQHLLDSFYMDQLGSVGCWVSPFTEVSFPNVDLNYDLLEIKIEQVQGSAGALESDIVGLADNFIRLITAELGFGKLTEELLAGIVQGPLRTTINSKIADGLGIFKKENPCLSHYPYDDVNDFLPWVDSKLIATVDKIIDEYIGYAGINKLFSCGTGGTGKFTIETQRLFISIEGLTSFYGLDILRPSTDPASPYSLSNYIAAGYCPSAENCNPLKIVVENLAQYSGHSALGAALWGATKNVEFQLLLENFRGILDFSMQLDKDVVRDLQLGQMSTTGCFASSFSTFVFDVVSLNVSTAELIYHNGVTETDITTIVDGLLSFITRPSTISNKNDEIALELSNANSVCKAGGVKPSSTDDDNSGDNSSSNSDAWKWQLFILVIACTASLAGLLMAYNYWGKTNPFACLGFNTILDENDERTMWERFNFEQALLFHPKVPMWIRYAVPIVILGDVAMFLNSNLDPKAVSVMVDLIIEGETKSIGSVFDFGLSGTVRDMWDAKVYPLSVLIALFSGGWPYVKLFAMLTVWVFPPKLLSIDRRETVLIVLDALGKWSLIDFFVMVLMLCAFYLQLFIAPNLSVNVTVKPTWGFYGFLLATMISLGLGHTILACHRLIVEPKVTPVPDAVEPCESLATIQYRIYLDEPKESKSSAESAHPQENLDNSFQSASLTSTHPQSDVMRRALLIRVTKFGVGVIMGCIALTSLFIVAGTFMMTMGFEVKGLVGLMLRGKDSTDYSYVSVGTSIPEHSGIPNDFAVRWMQTSYFLFGLGMPLGLMVCLSILWLVPLTLSKQRQLFVLTEVFNAWSTLDVFCISIAAALLEIQQFAAFIVGDSCDSINVILEKYLDEKLDGDDKCFDVVAYLTKVLCTPRFVSSNSCN